MAISRQKEAWSWDYALLLFWMTSGAHYSAQYHRQHSTLQAFDQFGALYKYNHDDKYSEPGTSIELFISLLFYITFSNRIVHPSVIL